MHSRFFTKSEFGICAGNRPVHVDTIARLESLYVRTNCLHNAGGIHSRCVGQIRLARVSARADVCIDRIQAGRFHAHQHLSRIRFQVGHILKLQDLGATKLAYTDRFHLLLLFERKRGLKPATTFPSALLPM